jgi:hypothetical protein
MISSALSRIPFGQNEASSMRKTLNTFVSDDYLYLSFNIVDDW